MTINGKTRTSPAANAGLLAIIRAEDILAAARNCVECIFLAAGSFGGGLKDERTDPIQIVADTASKKIDEAIALLVEYRHARNADDPSPVPAAAAAKPKSRPARTKRKGQ